MVCSVCQIKRNGANARERRSKAHNLFRNDMENWPLQSSLFKHQLLLHIFSLVRVTQASIGHSLRFCSSYFHYCCRRCFVFLHSFDEKNDEINTYFICGICGIVRCIGSTIAQPVTDSCNTLYKMCIYKIDIHHNQIRRVRDW